MGPAVGGLRGDAVGFFIGPAGVEAVGLAVGGLLGSAVGPVERLRGLPLGDLKEKAALHLCVGLAVGSADE